MRFWYNKSPFRYLLFPFHWLLWLVVYCRKVCYSIGIFNVSAISIPVIVVGNISVGGTGKSPLVLYLVRELQARGYKPGIISRGYGGNSESYPLSLTVDTKASESGDEALMLFQRVKVPMVVAPDRVAAAKYLTKHSDCDIIISDDGLQHYALNRDVELVVVEAQRQFGNELLMPFGPLREPISRLNSADAVITNLRFAEDTDFDIASKKKFKVYQSQFKALEFASLNGAESKSIAALSRAISEANITVDAVAGIGNPDAFFSFLKEQGINIAKHHFKDHHNYQAADFASMNGMILMTEKDAVKCHGLDLNNAWYLVIDTQVEDGLVDLCIKKIAAQTN